MSEPKQGSHPLPQSVFDNAPQGYVSAAVDFNGRVFLYSSSNITCGMNGWYGGIHHGAGFATPEQTEHWKESLTFREQPKPKVRLWSCSADVPVGAQFRIDKNDNRLILSATKNNNYFVVGGTLIYYPDMKNCMEWRWPQEYQDENAWKPCTVEEKP
jgi:hypothetical protein